jgi:hypothetical protein
MELRESIGGNTCIESIVGGNHFRVFRQNGPTANTGALFLACVRLFPFIYLNSQQVRHISVSTEQVIVTFPSGISTSIIAYNF